MIDLDTIVRPLVERGLKFPEVVKNLRENNYSMPTLSVRMSYIKIIKELNKNE